MQCLQRFYSNIKNKAELFEKDSLFNYSDMEITPERGLIQHVGYLSWAISGQRQLRSWC